MKKRLISYTISTVMTKTEQNASDIVPLTIEEVMFFTLFDFRGYPGMVQTAWRPYKRGTEWS